MTSSLPSFVPLNAPLARHANRYIAALLSADRDEARRIVSGAVHGASIEDIFLHIFERAQREFGRLWQMNEISVAQEHFATYATELIMAELREPTPVTRVPHTFVGTCASGESHCVGIRMISELLDRQGWKVYFTGANTPIQSIVDVFKHFPIDVLGISATTAMQLRNVRGLIATLRKNKPTQKVKVLVGGKIFNESPLLWKSVGADGYAENAVEGVALAKKLVTKMGSRKVSNKRSLLHP
jgi:methanogenic corrinoid protein MtbC1